MPSQPPTTEGTMMDSRLRVAALAGASGVAGSFAAAGYTREFVAAPVDALVVRATPGALVAWMITNVGESAHALHVALAVGITAGLLGATAVVGRAVSARSGWRLAGAGLAGVLSWAIAATVTDAPGLALAAGAPVAVVTAVEAGPAARRELDVTRRRVVRSTAGALGFASVASAVGWYRSAGGGGDALPAATGQRSEAVQQQLEAATDRELDLAADDVPGLVSPIGEFYNVDIAQFDPTVPDDDWTLTVTGEVESPQQFDFADVRERPTEHRFVTLRCVGEGLNGRKLDTAVWTGTPLKPLLEEVDPGGDCGCAMLRAHDDYFVQFPVDALEDAFLAWGMNGRPLPKSHGHPVRVLVPGHWGETNVKWLSEIELLDEEADGYWEERGWHGTGPVETVAKLWDDTRLGDGRIEVAGHAYAGTRGIERVEVSTDGGSTWTDAELSEPLPDEDVWRQWRHVYEADDAHEVVVRATDGEGQLQPEERADSFPSGATGWVSERIEP